MTNFIPDRPTCADHL